MAYVKFDGTGYFDVSIPALTSNIWKISFEVRQPDDRVGIDSRIPILGQTALIRNNIILEDNDSSPATKNVDSRAGAQGITLACPNFDFSSKTIVEIVSTGTISELYLNSVLIDTDNNSEIFDEITEYIGRQQSGIADPYELYFIEIEQDGIPIHRWEAPTDGQGLVMQDSIGSADATATGFSGSPFVVEDGGEDDALRGIFRDVFEDIFVEG